MKTMQKFKYRILDSVEGEVEGVVEQASGLYCLAAVTAVAQLTKWRQDQTTVTVWCEDLMPDFGPYDYVVWIDDDCNLRCANALRVRANNLRRA